ncbi:tRNA pseudouridine synthase 1 [Lecanosticta acicola]|uniref:tRNA pseudouridine synthase 1 n=1 Tax=Lecanosticta acicola TaxID=111012 RepID=A0AAI8Z4L4_9PEZI|nr:tRNA pseudouridine synthase 1 [Lecanosticta acicola]
MEHSTAILDDANKAIEAAASKTEAAEPRKTGSETPAGSDEKTDNNHNRHKRKGFSDRGMQHGARGGRGNNKRHKKGDMGRSEYFASNPDKRKRVGEASERRQREGTSGQGITFSKEEIDAEERQPKRKVAVLIGYSGTGYKGMQISGSEKTIEGHIFHAFIRAGAISKANAEDPKKVSLVRCARTDKGVHAAGNMISLKLIVEDKDIVEKINAELSPQIRVWGIERTIGSFSCYQACDSRWYEYLIPSHAFLPPHPSSWLAKQLEAAADECGDREGYESRQQEVHGFWEKVDEEDIKPILEAIDEDIRWDVVKALQGEEEANATKEDAEVEQPAKVGSHRTQKEAEDEKTEEAAIIINEGRTTESGQAQTSGKMDNAEDARTEPASGAMIDSAVSLPRVEESDQPLDPATERVHRLRAATKLLRNAYISARRRYRIPRSRVDRIQEALSKYVGTKNYHNYTIQKTFHDASAKRHIKSFVVNRTPILIGDGPDEQKTEWLSMKVHGQSFMMHQIRKMIGMVTLLVRSGATLETMEHSFTEARFSIPKVPGLGLLLERPVFDSYNNFQAVKHGRDSLDFGKYEKELEAFKEREIYQRIFREEEERNEFGRFYNHVDNFKEAYFLYVTSKGLEATLGIGRKGVVKYESEGEDGGNDEG